MQFPNQYLNVNKETGTIVLNKERKKLNSNGEINKHGILLLTDTVIIPQLYFTIFWSILQSV